MLRPAEGQTSSELASDMGLVVPDNPGWRLYDPAAVTVSAEPDSERRLTVIVGYAHQL